MCVCVCVYVWVRVGMRVGVGAWVCVWVGGWAARDNNTRKATELEKARKLNGERGGGWVRE